MEIISLLSVFVTGILAGIVSLDFWERRKVKLELTDTLAKINSVHNTLVQQVADMQERLNVHEFKLSGKK